MAKYRKRPVIIDAEQWFPGIVMEGVVNSEYSDPAFNGYHYIQTLEGRMIVSPGDWVITGVKGEKYACKPDVFEMTYDFVEEK
jgi:hypothetical protein